MESSHNHGSGHQQNQQQLSPAQVHKQYLRNQKTIKQAKGMIYANQAQSVSQNRGSGTVTTSEHAQKLGVMMLSSPGKIPIGRSLSNERDSLTAWGPNNTKGMNSISDAVNNQFGKRDDSLGAVVKNKGNGMRSNNPGMGYRSTGRGVVTSNTLDQKPLAMLQIADNRSVNAGASLNNQRKTRGSVNQSVNPSSGQNHHNAGVAKSINVQYYLQQNGAGAPSPTNFNSNTSASNKIVRYKNNNGNQRSVESPQQRSQFNTIDGTRGISSAVNSNSMEIGQTDHIRKHAYQGDHQQKIISRTQTDSPGTKGAQKGRNSVTAAPAARYQQVPPTTANSDHENQVINAAKQASQTIQHRSSNSPTTSRPFNIITRQGGQKFKFQNPIYKASILPNSYLSQHNQKRQVATAEGAVKTTPSQKWNSQDQSQQQQLQQPGSPATSQHGDKTAQQNQNSRTMPSPIRSRFNSIDGSGGQAQQQVKPSTSPHGSGLSKTSPHAQFQNAMINGRGLPGKGGVTTTAATAPSSHGFTSNGNGGGGASQDTTDVASEISPIPVPVPEESHEFQLLDRPNSSTAQPLHLSHIQLPNFEQTKYSVKENGVVRAYAANTNQGLVRDYNEDRVSIVLNMQKPPQKKCDRWPKCSFFAIFDGHGGHTCADFLRDNLHQFIIRDAEFPTNPRQAIVNGFWKSEMYFLDTVEKFSAGRQNMLDRSGSCAIVTLFVDDLCFSANVGDSRAIMSCQGGRYTVSLSYDHKPNEKDEHSRILAAGGKIYQTQSVAKVQDEHAKPGIMREQIMYGPHRVFPGRLSVSRTFGDIEAKRTKYQGNPKVVIATPDIKCFKIEDNYDFIVLGCDGIFDKLTNTQVIQSSWEASKKTFTDRGQTIHANCGSAVEAILKQSVAVKSLDNITVVIISFKNYRKALKAEIDKYNEDLTKQREADPNHANLEDAAEQIENKRTLPSEARKESGIVISKTLNLPNYDVTLEDVEVQPPLVGLARLQMLTTGSRSPPHGRGSPYNHRQKSLFNAYGGNTGDSLHGGNSFQSNVASHDSGSMDEDQQNNSVGGGSQGSRPHQQEKHYHIMGRRRGTAGQINPKQNGHADILMQSKVGFGHPNYIKSRQRSPLLPNTIGAQNIQQQLHGGRQLSRNGYDSVDGKPHATNTIPQANMQGGKPPMGGGARANFGLFNQSGKTSATPSNATTVGNNLALRNNSNQASGGVSSQEKTQTGMAESLRAQIATPRNNHTTQASADEMAQHRRYTNIVSQSRARRQIGGSSYGKPAQINTSLNGMITGQETESPSIFSPNSAINTVGNIFSNIQSPAASASQQSANNGLPASSGRNPPTNKQSMNFNKVNK